MTRPPTKPTRSAPCGRWPATDGATAYCNTSFERVLSIDADPTPPPQRPPRAAGPGAPGPDGDHRAALDQRAADRDRARRPARRDARELLLAPAQARPARVRRGGGGRQGPPAAVAGAGARLPVGRGARVDLTRGAARGPRPFGGDHGPCGRPAARVP